MSYKRCSPRQKEAIDLLLSGKCCNKPWETRHEAMGRIMGVSERSAKAFLAGAATKYQITYPEWDLAVRLCYLRAKELGML